MKYKTRATPRKAVAPFDDSEALLERGLIIGRLLGSGTFGKVYKVTPARMGEESLACKVFDRSKHQPQYRDKFFPRELDVITKVRHKHIIRLHSIYTRGTKVYILMECADNGDLLTYIQDHGAVPEAQARIWFHQLLTAFQYLHRHDIAHRDLKCENVLLDGRFNIKLADFGFARFCTGPTGRRELSRTYCGSLAYVAPEVVSTTPYNPKIADVWSMGVVLFVMVNAVMPFGDLSVGMVLQKQILKKWSIDRKVRHLLSPRVKQLLWQILEPDVTRRLSLDGIARHEWLQQPVVDASGDAP